MNPEQNQYPIDYLNQIAPEPKKSGFNNKILYFVIGGGILLIVLVGILMLFASLGGGGNDSQRLAARLQTLERISKDSQKNIKSSDLRSTNSTLSLFLTNAIRDIEKPLANNDVDLKKLDKNIVTEEANDKLTQTLEDARLNAIFDRIYAREMSYQLDTTTALMKKVYADTKSKSLKDFLVSTDTNLQPIKKQLADFNTVNN